MNTRKQKTNDHILSPAVSYPTNNIIREMVKKAEQELEFELQNKRDRLKCKINNESHQFHQEVQNKYKFLREYEFNLQRENLEKMKIDRELDRQKYIEMKQLQQHLQNSEELRIETSKRLLDECIETRKQQIQEKLKHESMLREMEQSIFEDAKRKQREEDLKREVETEQTRMQKKLEMRQQIEEQAARKRQSKQNDQELELKLMQQTDETLKKIEEENKKAKEREIQSQKEFLKLQIEQRKKDAELQRQRQIEYEKRMAEMAKQELERVAAEKAEAKKAQYVESRQFIDYMKRARSEKEKIEADKFDLKQTSLINEEIDNEAEQKRIEERRRLREEKRREYFKQLHERHDEKINQKQQDECVFLETQRQNAEYEEMMAKMRAQNRAQIQHDLGTQIKLKDLEMAQKLEEDQNCNQELKKLEQSSKMLTEKILSEGVQGLIKEHPFYRCMNSKNAHA